MGTIAGGLRRTWRNAGVPVDGAAGTYFGQCEAGDLLIDTTNKTLYQNTNTQASPTWTQITAGGVTLDGAYDYGGAGSGKAITVDSGAVALTNNAANNNGVLTLEKTPAGAQSGDLLTLTMGAQASGAALVFANSGSGNDITGTAGWSVQADGDATFLAISLANATMPAGTVVYIGRDNAGDLNLNALVTKTIELRVAGTNVVTIAGAAITLAQATTVTAGGLTVDTGGLTVSAGGAAITGNSTVTGDLSVTGALTFGGNWTVGATLTVDELILDTDGSAPAGTNVYLVRDNAGDGTWNVVTGKQAILAVNNTDEYLFSSTVADFSDNALDNVGYVILNAATAPAGTEVYLVNDNTGDLTANALAGKDFIVAIAGTDEVKFDDVAHIFNDASNDRDFRVETADLAYALYLDGGKNSAVLMGNTDLSDVNHLIRVGRLARTATDATSYYDLHMAAAGAVTTTGVTPVVAVVNLDEPNITVGGGSVTDATTLNISGEPTEGGNNYAARIVGSIGLIADAKDLVLGAGRDVLLRWSTADADNHALALGLGTSLAIHICQAADIATDWNVAADTNPTLYIHGATTPATEYVALSTDETDAHLNSVGANWKFEIGGTAELTLAANALNLVDSVFYGSSAAHSADTADGSMYLVSTSNATKGFICIANADLGLVVGSDGSVDRATTVGTNCIHIFNGTAPVGTLANGCSVYSTGGELYTMDAGGNATLQTQHSQDGDLIEYSYSVVKDKTVVLHLEKMLRKLQQKFPADFASLIEENPGLVHKGERVARGLGRI